MRKKIVVILEWLVLIIGIVLVAKRLDYLFVDDYVDSNNREFWHDFYSYEGEIDSICLGSSHVLCDLDPNLLDELSGYHFYDMSTTALTLNGDYYLLKECCKKHDVKRVYLELYHSVTAEIDSEEGPCDRIDSNCSWNWKNTDYMHFGLNKLEYMLTMGDVEKYINIFLPFTRYRSLLFEDEKFNIEYLLNNIENKKDANYLSYNDYIEPGDNVTYYKGFQHSNQRRSELNRTYYPNINLTEKKIGNKTQKYIRKIAEYCKKNEIELVLFISPIDRLQLMATGDYDAYYRQVKDISEELGVPFYDFNLCKGENLDFCTNEKMLDFEHFNEQGAEDFTRLFWMVVSQNKECSEDMFYPSFKDALAYEPAKLYGIFGLDFFQDEEGLWHRNNTIVCNHDEGMLYKISVKPDEAEEFLIQDYTNNRDFSLCVEGHGIITILAKDTINETEDKIDLEYSR